MHCAFDLIFDQQISLCTREKNPLLVELEPEVPLTAKANMWFEKVRELQLLL